MKSIVTILLQRLAKLITKKRAALVLLLLPLHANAIDLVDGEGVSFSQVDWTYTGASQSNSSTGQVYLDYSSLASSLSSNFGGATQGFINIVDGAGNWIAQNLPVDTTVSSATPGLSSMFNLGSAVGTDLSSVNLNVQLTAAPTTTAPTAGSLSSFNVGNVSNNAQGFGAGSAVTAPTAPSLVNTVLTSAFNGGLATNLAFQANHGLSVEQDINQCLPAALANSFQYLENSTPLNFADNHIPGIDGAPNNSMVANLDVAIGRIQGVPVGSVAGLAGKLQYLGDNINPDSVITEYQDITGNNGDVTVNGITATDKGDAPTAAFILDALVADGQLGPLAFGADVELGFLFDVRPGGHFVELIGGGTILGVPWITFIHDAAQGCVGPAVPCTTALNGGTGLFDGGIGFSFLLDTDGDGRLNMANYGDGESEVSFVMTERYVVPLPAAVWLFGCGLVGLIGIARRKTA